MILAFAVVFLFSALCGHAEQKRAFTIPDHYRVVGVGEPQVSPDGMWVAYVTTHTDLPRARRWSHIWLAPRQGGKARQLTQGEDLNTSPRFSPDGKHLAFLSNRKGKTPQIFLLPLEGGEPRQLTSFPGGAANPLWSPDGRFLAFQTEAYPECGTDAQCHEKIAKTWEEGPLAAHMSDELLYRHWDRWRDGRYTHIFLVRVRDGSLTDLTPGRFDSPSFTLGGETGFAFAPSSRLFVFTSNHDPVPALSTNSDLWAVQLGEDGTPQGEPENLTASNPAWDGHPAFSPDGRSLAYRCQAKPGYESDLFRLCLLDLNSKERRVVTPTFDNWIVDFAWAPSSQVIYFKAEVQGRTPLFELEVSSGKVREVLRHATVDAFTLTPDGQELIYSRRAVGEPSELYRSSVQGGQPTALTDHNRPLREEVDFRPAEEFWVDSGRGYKIHVFLVKPHGFDPAKKYPLILNVHGGPQSQWTDAYRGDWQVYPGAGYLVAFANPTGSTGYGQAFVDAIARDWGGRVFDDLMKVTDELEKLPFVDKKRMGAMGWSYGGYMMMWFAGHTQRFAALAAMMGVYNLTSMWGSTEELWFPEHDLGGPPWASQDYHRFSPSSYAQNFKTPTLVITGERDFRVPYTQSLEFFTALQRQGVPSRLVVFSKAGHWPSWYEMAFYYTLHLDWFHRYLGGGKPPWEVEKFLRNQVFP